MPAAPADTSNPPPTPPEPPKPPKPPGAIPTHAELFLAFLKISISGFGGTLPWTRRMFVEEKHWMTDAEFSDAYAVCQFLPGPNIVNLASVFGSRMRGATGSIACWTGFLGPPFLLMITVGALYARYGDTDALRRVLGGIAAAAAGIMLCTVVRMAMPLFRRLSPSPFVLFATIGAVAILRLPLLAVLLVLVPTSIALAWWVRR
jgi:chromate transporter